MKPPLVRAVYQDNYVVKLEWDPPAVPGEKKYELHWAGSVKDEFRAEELSEFGSLPTGDRTEIQIVWHNLDPTSKLTTFWFGVKTFTNSCEVPPTEFVKVVRKKFPGSWKMRVQKMSVIGLTLTWDPPSWKGHEFYRVVYSATDRHSGIKGITSGKLKFESTDTPSITIPWEVMDRGNRADTFCFIVSSMSDGQIISSSAPLFVKRDVPTCKVTHCEKPTDPQVFCVMEEPQSVNGVEPPRQIPVPAFPEPLTVRVAMKDYEGVELEWTKVDDIVQNYTVVYTSCSKPEMCMKNIENYGRKLVRSSRISLKWTELDPSNASSVFLFGVQANTHSGRPKQSELLRVIREWPISWNMRVDNVNYDTVSIVWDKPNTQNHEVYAVAYAASKRPGGGPISSGSFKTKSPNFTIRWDKMDPTDRAENFYFVVSSVTSEKMVVSSSDKFCVKRQRT